MTLDLKHGALSVVCLDQEHPSFRGRLNWVLGSQNTVTYKPKTTFYVGSYGLQKTATALTQPMSSQVFGNLSLFEAVQPYNGLTAVKKRF